MLCFTHGYISEALFYNEIKDGRNPGDLNIKRNLNACITLKNYSF